MTGSHRGTWARQRTQQGALHLVSVTPRMSTSFKTRMPDLHSSLLVYPGGMREDVLPDLWLDWCAVTRTPAALPTDSATLAAFTKQARPSARVLSVLRPPAVARPTAPAWPEHMRLEVVLARISPLLVTSDVQGSTGSGFADWVPRRARCAH